MPVARRMAGFTPGRIPVRLQYRHPLGKLAPMRVTMARGTGPVIEAKLRWRGRKLLRWTPMTLAAEDRPMSARKREARLPMSHKREGGWRKTVHRMTALAAIPVASALKLSLMYILVTSGAWRIVPMNNVEIAAIMFGMAVFTASP
jgi:hypothetical protein